MSNSGELYLEDELFEALQSGRITGPINPSTWSSEASTASQSALSRASAATSEALRAAQDGCKACFSKWLSRGPQSASEARSTDTLPVGDDMAEMPEEAAQSEKKLN